LSKIQKIDFRDVSFLTAVKRQGLPDDRTVKRLELSENNTDKKTE